MLAEGAVVVDVRPAAEFAAGHVPGSLNLPWNRGFTTYAGSVLPYDRELYFLVEGGDAVRERLFRSLVMIGLDRIAGWFGPDALSLWAASGRPLATIPQTTPVELAAGADGHQVVDVRGESEWRGGHLPGAVLIPLPQLRERLDEIPSDRPVVVHCQSGGRSAIAASVLRAAGREAVATLTGGYAAWVQAGLPVARD
jgi:hydroxyacylglutathione hydrolase